jgi:hypothetical protein
LFLLVVVSGIGSSSRKSGTPWGVRANREADFSTALLTMGL